MVKWFDYINQQRIGNPDAGEPVLFELQTSNGASKFQHIYIGEHNGMSIIGISDSTDIITCKPYEVFPVDYSSYDPIDAFGFAVSPIRPSTGEFIAVYMDPSGIQSGKYRWNVDKGLQVLDEEGQKWMASDDFIDIKDLTAIYIIAGGDRYEI